ncbi:MAG: hypothetical protein ACLQEI_11060 [Terriglobales bacterium]
MAQNNNNQNSGGFWQKLGNAISGNGWKTDAEVKQAQGSQQGSPTTPLVAAGAGLAPQANGAAQAAKAAAQKVGKTIKPGEVLRSGKDAAKDAMEQSRLRQLAKQALDTLGGIAAGLANGATEVVVPVPVPSILLHPNGDPDDCHCT